MRSPPRPVRLPAPATVRRPAVTRFTLALGLVLAVAGPARAQVPTFQPPVAVDPAVKTDTHSDELPRIAAGVAGVWVLVWQVVGAGDLKLGRDVDVVYSRSSDDGAHWTAPKPLTAR